jgi:hypothetical protein
MNSATILTLAVVVLVVVVLGFWFASRRRRSAELRSHFGAEYDRAVDAGRVERALTQRAERVETDTEELRLALRRYRAFFDRLLTIQSNSSSAAASSSASCSVVSSSGRRCWVRTSAWRRRQAATCA